MKTICIGIAFSLLTWVGTCQDFLQFDAYPLILNPALAGSASCSRLIMGNTLELPVAANLPRTHLSFDSYIKKLRGGIGFQMTSRPLYRSDRLGGGNVRLSYAPKFNFDLWRQQVTLSPAVQLGYEVEQHDYREPGPNSLTLGVLLNTREAMLGITYDYAQVHYFRGRWVNGVYSENNLARYFVRDLKIHFHYSYALNAAGGLSLFLNAVWGSYESAISRSSNIGARYKKWIYGIGTIGFGNEQSPLYFFTGYGTDFFATRIAYDFYMFELKFQYSFNYKRPIAG